MVDINWQIEESYKLIEHTHGMTRVSQQQIAQSRTMIAQSKHIVASVKVDHWPTARKILPD